MVARWLYYKLYYSAYNQFAEIRQIIPKWNLNHDYPQILPLKFLHVIRRMTEIFFNFEKYGSRDPQGQSRGRSKGQKVIAPKHAYFENFLTEMES